MKTSVTGTIEVLEVLLSFRQHLIMWMAIHMPTELKPTAKVLKCKKELESISPDSEDILFRSKFET